MNELEDYSSILSHEQRQGLENRIIAPGKEIERSEGTIECREHLGGLLRYYTEMLLD